MLRKSRKEYIDFLTADDVKKELKIFDQKKHKLDTFLCNRVQLCTQQKSSDKLIDFIKRTLIFVHGNAAIERSFSFNSNFLVENLQENSLSANMCTRLYY